MKKNKIKLIALLLSVFSLTIMSSCDEGGNPDAGGTKVEKYAGDWWIALSDPDGEIVGHVLHSTYNTAANDNTMWIDDHSNGYWIKAKVNVNLEDGTFSATDAENIGDSGTVTITDGKIIKDGGHSRAGHVVDSIYFKAHYSYDDDGYDIIYTGHKRTGFSEDEY